MNRKIQQKIVSRITRAERIVKIILFGSYAKGNPNSNSDIDLIVVLDSDTIPGNFKERTENYLRISRSLRDLKKEYPIDLIVYTKPEFNKFISMKSIFSKRIMSEGKNLL